MLLCVLLAWLINSPASAESSNPECNNACAAAGLTALHLAYSATAGATFCVLSGCAFRGYDFDTMAGLFAYSSIGAGSLSLVSTLGYYGIAQSEATTTGYIVAYVSGLIVGGVSALIWGYSALKPGKSTSVSLNWRTVDKIQPNINENQSGRLELTAHYLLD